MKFFRNIYNKIIDNKIVTNFTQRFLPDCLILYYHDVVTDAQFEKIVGPNRHLVVKESEFLKQISFLKDNYEVIPIREVGNIIKSSKPKICITFDDGYKNNIRLVYPIIEKNKINITIYLITRILEGDSWVWWFELWDIIKKKNNIKFFYNSKNYQFSCSNIYEKNKVFNEVKNIIYKLSLNNQKKILARISGKKIRPKYEDFFLNKHDVKSMDYSFVNFGSHGHSHLNYKFSSKKEILDDIIRSQIVLKKIFKKDTYDFAYPYGSLKEVSLENTKFISSYFKTAVSTDQNICVNKRKEFLPRISIGPNISISDFKSKIIGTEFLIKNFFNKQ